MSRNTPKRKKKWLAAWTAAAGLFALAVGPCPNLQDPPTTTGTVAGVAISPS